MADHQPDSDTPVNNASVCLQDGQLDPAITIPNTIIQDESYTILKSIFLMEGRGRRPTVPALTLTNKVLVQLSALREEAHASWNLVLTWFMKIFPDERITEAQLQYKIQKTVSSYDSLPDNIEELAKFLSMSAQESIVPDHLTSIGLNKSILLDEVSKYSPPVGFTPTVNTILSLEVVKNKTGLGDSFLIRWIQALCCDSNPTPSQVKQQLVKAKKDKLKLKHKPDKLADLLARRLFDSGTSNTISTTKSLPVTVVECNHNYVHEMKLLKMHCDSLRKQCDEFKNVITELEGERDMLKERLCLSVKEKVIVKKKGKNVGIQSTTIPLFKVAQFQAMLEEKDKIIDSVKSERDDMEHKMNLLKKEKRAEQQLKSKYKKELDDFRITATSILELEAEHNDVKLRDSRYNQFSDDVRLTCMSLMGEANVAAQHCSLVIQIVSKYLFKRNFDLSLLPCASTVLNFASEAAHIAHHHVVDEINKTDHFTFATDGTSRDKKHFIERHIVLDNKLSLSLGFSEVASDNAQTLLEKTIEIFDDMSQIYSSTNSSSKDNIFKSIITKMKCIMSDRASVMKCYGKKLAAYKNDILGEDSTTHFLFCNAHFLLGLVKATEDACSKIESEVGKFGRDLNSSFQRFANDEQNAAFRLIRLTSDVLGPRGDEKNGSREEWLAFCSSIGKSSKFTSFRSNRFNNLFENAYAIIFHYHDIESFLTDYVTHSNLKLQSIFLDLNDDRLISMITAIALFSKLFTTPFWRLMNSDVPYGQFPKYVKLMKDFLDQWKSEISFSLSFVFDDSFCNNDDHDHVLTDVISSSMKCDNSLLKSTYIEILKESEIVLKRQLDDFLEDGIYGGELDQETQMLLNSSPLTNLVGERIFGDFDFDLYKRRHASLHLRSTLNMLKRNKTSVWLGRQTTSQVTNLLITARRNAPALKLQSKIRQQRVQQDIIERMQECKRLKRGKELKKMQDKTSILESIIGQGGVVSTKEELDRLVASPKALENLRCQLKYRKVVLLEQINYGGNLSSLYFRICQHLDFEPSPLPKKIKLDES